MDFQKLKIRSGIIALVSILLATPILFILRDFLLPDDYGVITFETYHGLGLVIYGLHISFLIFASLWIVLMFTDLEQPDTLDKRTKYAVVGIGLAFSFINGLVFYTDLYFLFSFLFPLASGLCITHYYRDRYPPGILRAYNNLSILFGMILGYMVATVLVWNHFDEMNGEEFLGMEKFSQYYSLFRIGVFIGIYVFMSFISIVIKDFRRSQSLN